MINRRTGLGLLGGALLGACRGVDMAADISAGPKEALDLDPSNLEDLHYMHRKLAYTLDDQQLTYWSIEALRMGFKDGVLTPFWKMHFGIIYAVKSLGDYRYSNEAILKGFYTDLKTGQLLQSFDNPYTGETVQAVQPKLFKTKRIYGLSGIESPEREPNPRFYKNDDIGPARIIGDDIWLNADSIMRSLPPNRRSRLVQVNDWSTFHGSMREVADPSLNSARATHTFNDLNTFNHSWIGMNDVKEAWSISRGFGRKSHSPDRLPEIWKKLVAVTHPELLSGNPEFE